MKQNDKEIINRLDALAKHVLQNKEDIQKLSGNLDNYKKDTLDGQDQMMTVLKKLDQERVFSQEWTKRIEKQVDQNTKNIKGIQQELKTI